VVVGVAVLSAAFEGAAAVSIAGRLWLGYDYSFGAAVYRGVFHAVSAFNNAGFALWSDSLVGFVSDGWMSLTVALTAIAGGLGFPVWLELVARLRKRRRWTLHTKLTLVMTGALLAFGTIAILAFEWGQRRDDRPAQPRRQGVGELLPGRRDATDGRLQQRGRRPGGRGEPSDSEHADVRRSGKRIDRGRYQGHDLRAAGAPSSRTYLAPGRSRSNGSPAWHLHSREWAAARTSAHESGGARRGLRRSRREAVERSTLQKGA
jgi:hypothetical protein